MKKFFSYLGWLLLLAAIIAAFTATGKEQCKQYVSDKLPPGSAVNIAVSESPFKIFSIKLFSFYTVTYYKPTQLSLQQQTASATSPAVAALKAASGMTVESYLGLYNTFWKL